MRRWRLPILILTLAVGCSRDVPRDGGTLVRRLEADITTLNPLSGMGTSGHYVAKYLFTPLVYLDEHQQPVPGLANWTISPDRCRYRFVLNENATFSDGSKVLANDVIFTLRKIADPEWRTSFAAAFNELDMARTRAINDKTVEVVFHRAIANQLDQFSLVYILPEHFYAGRVSREDFQHAALGSGPYTLVRRVTGKEIVLRRRPNYWREKPHIETVILRVIGDYTTAWMALKVGDIDESYIPTTAWARERRDPELNRRLRFETFYTFQYNAVAWNTAHPFLRDANVRRALAMSLPADTVARDIYYGTARAITGPFTPDQPGYDKNVPPLPYAPQEARRILRASGWLDRDGDGVLDRNGERFAIELLADEEKVSPIIRSYLGKIGVRVDIRKMDFAALQQAMNHGNYTAAYVALTLDRDPDLYPLFHSTEWPDRGKNTTFYKNSSVDRLIEKARVEGDPLKRQRLQHQLHAALAQEQPYSWAIELPSNWGINRRVHGVKIVGGAGLFFWYPGELEWSLEPD
jgi:peptide/nickel transport system substrate-binding protein